MSKVSERDVYDAFQGGASYLEISLNTGWGLARVKSAVARERSRREQISKFKEQKTGQQYSDSRKKVREKLTGVVIEGADALRKDPRAADIAEYWRSRGYPVKVWLEQYIVDGKASFRIRTDLVGGLPKGWRGKAVKSRKRGG